MNRAATQKFLFYAAAALVLGAGAVLRLSRLGALSLSGDEGFTALAVRGILENGYPLYPSGDVYYKSILYSFAAAAGALAFGANELALRLPNAFFSIALVPLAFFGLRKRAGAAAAVIAALALALNVWQIEFAREARYYCQLQFFFTAACLAFFGAYMEDKKHKRLWFFVFAAAAVLTLKLAIALIVLFLVPPLLRGPRAVCSRAYIACFALTAAFFGAWQVFEVLFWKMASINAKGTIVHAGYSFYFLKAYDWLFPKMTAVVVCGLAANTVLYLRSLCGGKSPAGLTLMTFLNLTFFSVLLLMGFGKAHYEPRYITFTAPLFFMLYALTLALAAKLTVKALFALLPGASAVCRLEDRGLRPALTLVFALLFFGATCEGMNPLHNIRIARRTYTDAIGKTKYTSSTSRRLRWDCKSTGEYVRDRLRDGDMVIGTHMVFAEVYAGRSDYWLWSANAGTWNAFYEKDGQFIDTYLGRPLLRSLAEFKELLAANSGRNVWLVTTPSIKDHNHISPDIRRFVTEENAGKTVFRGGDGVSAVLLWPADTADKTQNSAS